MKLYLTKENAKAGDLTEPRYEIRKLNPAEKRYEELFKVVHDRLSLLEKQTAEQESWVAMLIEQLVKIKKKEELH